MTRTILTILLVISGLALFLISCNPQPKAITFLEKAESLTDQDKADSALLFIDSIFYPEKSFSKEKYMQYIVTRIRASYKAYKDIKSDTTIFEAKKYFVQQAGNPRWAALATFYSGCVYKEQGNTKKAMAAYSEANSYASKTDDNNLKGLIAYNIGDLFNIQQFFSQALVAYKRAFSFYKDIPAKQLLTYCSLGNTCILLEKTKLAHIYYEKGLYLARKIHDIASESMLLQNMSITYSVQKKYDQSLKYLQQAYKLNSDSTRRPRFYLNFANIYLQMGKVDSAQFYGNLAKQKVSTSKDVYIKAAIYNSLGDIERQKKNFQEEADLRNLEIDAYEEILKKNNDQAVMDAYQKYNFEQEKTAHEKLFNQYLTAVIILLLSIIAGGIIFSWYVYRERKLKHHIMDNITLLARTASELQQSHQKELLEKDTTLRMQLLWKFDVIRKSALLLEDGMQNLNSSYLLNEFKRIVYSENENDVWKNLLPLIDSMEKNLSERIKLKFPELSEIEFRVSLLSYAGLNTKEIAVMLNMTQRAVQTCRTLLRKKLKLEDTKIDTGEYLRKIV